MLNGALIGCGFFAINQLNAWRDIAGTSALHATLRETSWFAEATIASAARMAATLLAPRHGSLPAEAGGLIVLGMGKLGGSELNFSSDVDLVFLYRSSEGETEGPVPLALEEFYIRQGRLLLLHQASTCDRNASCSVSNALRPSAQRAAAGFQLFRRLSGCPGRDWER